MKPKERLDFILLSPKLQVDFLQAQVIRNVQRFNLSDHLPVQVTLKSALPLPPPEAPAAGAEGGGTNGETSPGSPGVAPPQPHADF